jgi:hypothetical protein
MEKLIPFTDPETSALWTTFRDTPLKDLIMQGDERAKAFLPLSPEQIVRLQATALEAAFVEGSVNFLLLYLLLLPLTSLTLTDFAEQVQAAEWERDALVRQLATHLAVLNVTETPAPIDTFQLKETDLPLFTFKVDKLRRFSFPDLAEKFAHGMLPYRAFRSLDVDAFVGAVAQHCDLAVISLLLTIFSAEELVAIATKHSGGQLAFSVALLWRLVHPLSTDETVDTWPAIGALLTQLKQNHPAAYGPVITYFNNQAPFLAGFTQHLSSLDTLPDMRLALASIPIGAKANPKSTTSLVTVAFYALHPGNKALFRQAVYDLWEEWCQQQINDPNVPIHQLPLSSFETAVADHFLATLAPDTAVEQSSIHLAALRSIDGTYFESRPHQNKTIEVHFAHLHFIAPSLPTPLPEDNLCTAIANRLLADPIWMARHLRPHPNHILLEELLRRFSV